MKNFTIFCLVVFGLLAEVKSQDIHYSQFYNASILVNPALTGIFRGDVRVAANYRHQWHRFPVDYKTFSVGADLKFPTHVDKNGFFSGGLIFHHDQAGISKLALNSVGINGAFTKQLSKNTFVTLGAGLSANSRGFKTGGLTFDKQYDPQRGVYQPGSPTGESFDNTSNFFPSLDAGINLRFQADEKSQLLDLLTKRSKLDIGLGFFHLNRPDQSFLQGPKSPLFVRLSPYAMGALQVGSDVDLVGNFVGQLQGPYREFLVYFGIKPYFNRQVPNKQAALQLGASYRFHDFGDAVNPTIELFYGGWQVGFSYDITISEAKTAVDGRGGPELSVRYMLRRVKPLPSYRVCPII